MQNYRKQIKELFIALFKEASQTTGISQDLIFSHKRAMIDFEEEISQGLVVVDIDSENSSTFSKSPRQSKRTLKMSVLILKGKVPENTVELEDQLYELAHKFEEIMIRWELKTALRDIVNDLDFEGCELIYREESEFKQGMAKLSYSIVYYQDESIPETEFDDFLRGNSIINHQNHKEFESKTVMPQ